MGYGFEVFRFFEYTFADLPRNSVAPLRLIYPACRISIFVYLGMFVHNKLRDIVSLVEEFYLKRFH